MKVVHVYLAIINEEGEILEHMHEIDDDQHPEFVAVLRSGRPDALQLTTISGKKVTYNWEQLIGFDVEDATNAGWKP